MKETAQKGSGETEKKWSSQKPREESANHINEVRLVRSARLWSLSIHCELYRGRAYCLLQTVQFHLNSCREAKLNRFFEDEDYSAFYFHIPRA